MHLRVCVEVLMFLGVRVHLYMGCVAASGSEKIGIETTGVENIEVKNIG